LPEWASALPEACTEAESGYPKVLMVVVGTAVESREVFIMASDGSVIEAGMNALVTGASSGIGNSVPASLLSEEFISSSSPAIELASNRSLPISVNGTKI
jgi:hypothetical protein